MNQDDKIYIAGHTGLVGSAILRKLKSNGYNNLITRSRMDLNLVNQNEVQSFFKKEKPSHVILAAARVGGISANNKYPADFIYENLMIQANIIHSAYLTNVEKLLFLGSTCIYPKNSIQPIKESELLNGYLEPTNEPYAVAKIAGIKLCESYNRQFGADFRSIMPTNLYGINDNFHKDNSHVIPGLIRKFHEAKENNQSEVEVWGSGSAMREFLYVDDMADASTFVINLKKEDYEKSTNKMMSHINVGTGKDISIKDLAELIKTVTGYGGDIIFDKSKPDGTEKKCIDVSKLSSMGWNSKTELADGLNETYKWFKLNNSTAKQ